MSGEDNGAAVHFIENIQTVMPVQRNNSVVLKGIRHMRVVHNHAKYINRPGQIKILCGLPCHNHGIDDTVAIAPGRNFEDFHVFSPAFCSQ
ncbi:hypothetical protein D3C81_1625460 [compost metagenome]